MHCTLRERCWIPQPALGQEPQRSRMKVGASRGSLRSCPGHPDRLSLTTTGMGTGRALRARSEARSGAPRLLNSVSQLSAPLGFQALNMRGSSSTSPPARFPPLALSPAPLWGYPWVGACSGTLQPQHGRHSHIQVPFPNAIPKFQQSCHSGSLPHQHFNVCAVRRDR